MPDIFSILDRPAEKDVFQDPDKMIISFISTDLFSFRTLEKSILSIDRIGEEVGKKYEILIGAKNNSRYDSFLFRDLERKIEQLSIIRIDTPNGGMAKRIATNLSTGEFLVFFDSTISYDLDFADLISSYIRSGEKRILLSDFMIINRDILIHSGGYRDLSISEDIDLLSRIFLYSNIIAFPVVTMRMILNQAVPLPALNKSERENLLKVGLRTNGAFKDQIVACNYSIQDVLNMIPKNKANKITTKLEVFFAYLRSAFSKTRPVKMGQNNYLMLMDKLLESIILSDFKKFEDFRAKPLLRLSSEQYKYLEKSSKSWNSKSLEGIVVID